MREHANLVDALVGSPYYQRDFEFHSYLDREYCLSCDTMPVYTPQPPHCCPGNSFYLLRLNSESHYITIKKDSQMSKISDSHVSVIMFVISDKQGIHTIDIFYSMNNEVRIFGSAYRNNTIV